MGTAISTGAKSGVGYVNEKIEANPTLANAKTATAQKIGAATTYLSGLVWGKPEAEQNEEEKKEEVIGNDDSFEESKEEAEGEPQEQTNANPAAEELEANTE